MMMMVLALVTGTSLAWLLPAMLLRIFGVPVSRAALG